LIERVGGNMKRIVLLSALTVAVIMAYPLSTITFAAPNAPIIGTVFQPDGTKLKVRKKGDEWNSWVETVDGYLIIKNKETNWWYYAVKDEKHELQQSTYPAGKANPEELNLKKHLSPKLKKPRKHLPPKNPIE
jgi:hypothetical protein